MSLERTGEVLAHDKQKEVEAVARKMTSLDPDARGDWLFTLPFAGTGMSNPRISLGEIYNFAVSIMALDPAPGDWILDLGSGSCWVSEWLSRMLIHTVSVDISPDMLRIGQQRLGPGARLAAGDFEALPFASGSFDGAVCISALHHVPDIPRTLSEIRRVLKDTGRAVFSEPGRGHASSPQSQAEMQELGVLERDVVAAELLDECLRAGFQTAQVHPYLFPLPAHSPEEWRAMQASGEPRLRSDKRGAGPGAGLEGVTGRTDGRGCGRSAALRRRAERPTADAEAFGAGGEVARHRVDPRVQAGHLLHQQPVTHLVAHLTDRAVQDAVGGQGLGAIGVLVLGRAGSNRLGRHYPNAHTFLASGVYIARHLQRMLRIRCMQAAAVLVLQALLTADEYFPEGPVFQCARAHAASFRVWGWCFWA